jgi:class 3 adenylate cyclase
MADLEALAEIKTVPGGSGPVVTAPGRYTWRYALPENKPVRLGSDPAQCDWVVPEDRMISRFHATVQWDGTKLVVQRRGVVLPDYPKPPQNHIWFRNSPVERCEVRPGEWFVIGQTRFTVRGDEEAVPASPVDATLVHRREEYTRAELEGLAFSDPAAVLKALEQLPNYLRAVSTEPALFRQMLKVALAGIPRADAAAVVRVAPDPAGGELRVAVVEQNVRATTHPTDTLRQTGLGLTAPAAPLGEFAPSRKLVRQAVRDRKSCLHVWSTNPADIDPGAAADHTMTLGALYQSGATPWAVCTPFQDGSPYALYVSGRLIGMPALDSKMDTSRLTGHQKFVEMLVGLIESTRRTLRLARQNELSKVAWPTRLRKELEDPERLEALLKPRERDVTVLFCDLRNYSGFAEEHGSDLAKAWREIATALDTMSTAVTEKGGIVAGFRGDAVLGFWGWPEPTPDQAERAAEAALRIHEKLSGWMQQRRCGLGLTHGTALVGRLGAHDLGVVDLYGPVVNLAFRLEEMTKAFGVGIVISDELANQLIGIDPCALHWRMRLLGRVRPRGMKVPLAAFELAPPSGSADAWLAGQWNEAVAWFTAGNWSAARERLADLFESDPVAQCIIRHIDRTRGKPPTDWDGAFLPRPAE